MIFEDADLKPWARRKDRAVYLPSVQPSWAEVISCDIHDLRPNGPIPTCFTSTDHLNFLLPRPKSAFWWPRCLYSPGHTTLDLDKLEAQQSAILRKNRNRRSMVVCDSGGFQIGTGSGGEFQIDWSNGAVADNLRERVLRWQEAVGEWGTILDVPAIAIVGDEPHPFFGRDFAKCAEVTKENIRYFLDHRTGETKHLNVIQGRDTTELNWWYDQVKEFKELEGWSIPVGRMDLVAVLKLLRRMLDEGSFDNTGLIHFLGIGRPTASFAFTTMKRELIKILGKKDLEISYDTASPWEEIEYYQIYSRINPRYRQSKLPSCRRFNFAPKDSLTDNNGWDLVLLRSPILRFDFHDTENSIRNKDVHVKNAVGKATFDKLSMSMIAVHNAYYIVRALEMAQDRVEAVDNSASHEPYRIFDLPQILDFLKIHYATKGSLKGAEGAITSLLYKFADANLLPDLHGEVAQYIEDRTTNSDLRFLEWALECNSIFRRALTAENAFDVIDNNRETLRNLF